MVRPRDADGTHSAIAFTLPGQPLDCATPLIIIATRKKIEALERPKAKQAAAETSIPKLMRRRAPRRSPRPPQMNWPTAYMARYTVSTPRRAFGPKAAPIAVLATG